MTETQRRIEDRFQGSITENACRADRVFAVLMVVQLIAGIAGALWLSPRTWAGPDSAVHVHVWASAVFGTVIGLAPIVMILTRPGRVMTRHTVAVAQMLFSVLLIHVCGGRIETHFHVFGSLAFLAMYRDWRVLITATVVISIDHLARGVYWPESVFGVLTASPWRAFEHAGWVVFEDAVLIYGCIQNRKEMRLIARTRVELEESNKLTEEKVRLRTRQLESANTALRTSDERYRLVVEGTREAVWDWDLVNNTVYYAPNWRTLFGIPDDTELSNSPDDWFSRICSRKLSYFQSELTRHLAGKTTRFDLEVEMHHTDGSTRWMLCRAAASRGETGVATRLTGSLTDITELKQAQDKLRKLADFDALTDLPNRKCFHHLLRAVLENPATAARSAVAFFDFDRFKVVNDSLGHNTGDALLRSIAERFRQELRPRDVVARFGGDEFVVLLRDIDDTREVRPICERLLSVFAKPHDIDGHQIVSTASIGVIHAAAGDRTPDEMIRDADSAMYRAKSMGRDRYQVFDDDMHDQAMARLNLESDLRNAIANQQLEVYYQPIVSTFDGEINAFEALVRWNHPELGLVNPGYFIPLAEETGLIVDIGNWVLREACAQLNHWRSIARVKPGFYLSVNLSRRQLIHPEVIDHISAILEETGTPPHLLCLEITESVIMDERQNATAIIDGIKELGVKLALDDFGTGHSSLSCLHSFPIDILKIDQSFMRNLGEKLAFSAVLNSIICLGHHLNMKIIAEGIETLDQLAHIQALDCEMAQGYYFARPVDAEHALQLLTAAASWRRPAMPGHAA